MAELEQEHRHECEKKALPASDAANRRGQYFGFYVAGGAILAAAIVAVLHGDWRVSVALVGVPVLGAVQAFLGHFGNQDKEQEQEKEKDGDKD